MGKQWAWDFNYLQQGGQALNVYEPGVQGQMTGKPGVEQELPTLYLPVGRRVQFELTSRDVIHSFWIPAFLYKLDVIPGVRNKFQVVPERIGAFRGKCAELCGEYHSQMLFNVRVVSQADFDAHIQQLRAEGNVGTLDSNLGRSHTPPGPGASRARTPTASRAPGASDMTATFVPDQQAYAVPVTTRKGRTITRWLITTDHKAIGNLYLFTSMSSSCSRG